MRAAFFAGIAALGLLAGCANTATPGVTIAQVQAESAVITTALAAGAAIYTSASSTRPEQAAAVKNMLAAAQAANAALQGGIDTSNWVAATESASQDIAALLSVLPIDPATKIAVAAGMAVLDTFVAEQTGAPTANAPRALTAPASPPVVIPMPRPNAPRVL